MSLFPRRISSTIVAIALAACGNAPVAPTATPESSNPLIATLELTGPPAMLLANDTVSLTLVARTLRGRTSPRIRSGGVSDDPLVATVTSAGRVTAIGNGRAVIAASRGHLTAYTSIVVGSPCGDGGVARLVISQPAAPVAVGSSISLHLTAFDATGAGMDTVGARPLIWTTSNPSVAALSSAGVIDAVAPGTVELSVTCAQLAARVPFTVVSP